MDIRYLPLSTRPLATGGALSAPASPGADNSKAVQAAVKFESFFIAQCLHKMRDATRALADNESRDRINDDMLDWTDNLVADSLASQRAFGIADAILRQLLPAHLTESVDASPRQFAPPSIQPQKKDKVP